MCLWEMHHVQHPWLRNLDICCCSSPGELLSLLYWKSPGAGGCDCHQRWEDLHILRGDAALAGSHHILPPGTFCICNWPDSVCALYGSERTGHSWHCICKMNRSTVWCGASLVDHLACAWPAGAGCLRHATLLASQRV